jgi:hypothetical protein
MANAEEKAREKVNALAQQKRQLEHDRLEALNALWTIRAAKIKSGEPRNDVPASDDHLGLLHRF